MRIAQRTWRAIIAILLVHVLKSQAVNAAMNRNFAQSLEQLLRVIVIGAKENAVQKAAI